MSAPYPPVDGTEVCAQTDPDAWFPDAGSFPHRYNPPALCAGCHVQKECLDYAVDAHVEGLYVTGIWGGTTDKQRRRIRQQRRAS